MKIEIVEFKPEYRGDFKKLNVEWLQKYFEVEPFDEQQLSNPETEILEKDGKIFFAKEGDRIFGTASLLKESDRFDLAKMAVTEDSKGKGIGNLLMDRCMAEAKKLGAEKIVLTSNRILILAITMYEKYGFREVPIREDIPCERGNIRMELIF